MNKLYNISNTIVNNFLSYFNKFSSYKPLLNFMPQLFFSLISSESVTFSKISLNFINNINSSIQLESVSKRIHRFLHNPKHSIHNIFDSIVDDVLSKYKSSHSDLNIHVSFDHMFVEEKHTILMFSFRIGKQGIPIFFKVFPGKKQKNHGDAFKMTNIKEGILYCHNLIKKYLPNAKIIFLADRWFGNLFPLLNYIDSLGDTFVIRCKQNMKVFYQIPKENHKVWIQISQLPHFVHHSKLYSNLEFTEKKYIYNLAYCKSKDHKEAWLLITNDDPKKAKGFYGYRFGSIEFIFKSQKTNGFYLEKTGVRDLKAFENLYSMVCIACLYLTCLGTEISKNSKCYRNLGFRITRKNSKTNCTYRVMSRFKAGLTLFKLAINSPKYFRLPTTFTLYDS